MLAEMVLARPVAAAEATTAMEVEGQMAKVAAAMAAAAAAKAEVAKVGQRVEAEGGELEKVASLETAPQAEMERAAEEETPTPVGLEAETGKAGSSTRTPRCRSSPHQRSSSRTARAHAPCTPPSPVQRSSE